MRSDRDYRWEPSERMQKIARRIADALSDDGAAVFSASRRRAVVRARQRAIWVLRRADPDTFSSTVLGGLFALDHTTTLYSVRKVDRERLEDAALARRLDRLVEWARSASQLNARRPPPIHTRRRAPTMRERFHDYLSARPVPIHPDERENHFRMFCASQRLLDAMRREGGAKGA